MRSAPGAVLGPGVFLRGDEIGRLIEDVGGSLEVLRGVRLQHLEEYVVHSPEMFPAGGTGRLGRREHDAPTVGFVALSNH